MRAVVDAAQAVEWRGCVTDDQYGIVFVVSDEVWQPMCDALEALREYEKQIKVKPDAD